jgi:arylsulfatase A-like enzyme
LFILTSDHGEEFFEHGGWGHCTRLYDEQVKVPLIVKFPKSKYRGKRIDRLVELVDIMPTVLEEAEIKTGALSLDGKSLLGVLEGRDGDVRTGMSYLPHHIIYPIPESRAVVREGWKFLVNRDYEPEAFTYFSPPPARIEKAELYDLGRDPLEKRNLAGQERNRSRELLDLLQKVFQEGQEKLKSRKFLLDKELEDRLRALGYIQ